MDWGFDRRFAVGGWAVAAVFALGGVGITILWPEEKNLGWWMLFAAGVVLSAWLCFESVLWFGRSGKALAVSSFLCLAVLGGWCFARWKWGRTVPDERGARIDTVSRESQYDLIRSFITSKNEYELRHTFDFPAIVRDELILAHYQVDPDGVSVADADLLSANKDGGQIQVTLKFVKTLPNGAIAPIPGKLGFTLLTPTFVTNRLTLSRIYSSDLLPSKVVSALKEFDETIALDIDILIDTTNEQMAKDPRTVTRAYECPSRWCSKINNEFAQKFIPLKPKADAISAALRESINNSDK